MIQIINFIKKLLIKYNSLRQEAWTHVLMPFSFIYWGYFISGANRALEYDSIFNLNSFLFLYLGESMIYPYGMIVATITAIITSLTNKKLTNKFLTKNKFYGIFWHLGNILLLLFIPKLILLLIIFPLVSKFF